MDYSLWSRVAWLVANTPPLLYDTVCQARKKSIVLAKPDGESVERMWSQCEKPFVPAKTD